MKTKLQALDETLCALAAVDIELYPTLSRREIVAFFDSFEGDELDDGIVMLVSLYAEILSDEKLSRAEVLTHFAYDALLRGLDHSLMKLMEEFFQVLVTDRLKAHSIKELFEFYDWRNSLMHFALSAVDVSRKQLGGTRAFSIAMMRSYLLRTYEKVA